MNERINEWQNKNIIITYIMYKHTFTIPFKNVGLVWFFFMLIDAHLFYKKYSKTINIVKYYCNLK